MTSKMLWCVVGLLGATCAGQAYHIYSSREARAGRWKAPAEDFWKEQHDWIARAREQLLKGGSIPPGRFDELFDDAFFGRRFDPFAEIENFNKRIAPFLREDERALFGRSWNEWFTDRLGVADVETGIEKTDKEVVLSIRIPGLKGESLKIDVNDDRIRIAYDAESIERAQDGAGRTAFQAMRARHFVKILPIPEDADPKTSRVVREGGALKVVFRRVARLPGGPRA